MSRPLNPWKLSGFKPGQHVQCRIERAEAKGYAVLILKENLPGFLPTQASLRIGEEILAQYVTFANSRIVLAPLVSSANTNIRSSTPSVRWEDQLDSIHQDVMPENENIDQSQIESYAPQPQTQSPFNLPATIEPIVTPPAIVPPNNAPRTQHLATHIQTPFVPDSEANAQEAFAAWVTQAQPRRFHLKRATDLILPPLQDETEENFQIADYDLEWLITQLEGGMNTGCVKASSEQRLSRSAMLLYRGRAVGCIYGCKSMPETQPTEQSLQLMLADLELSDTTVRKYDLPETVTLAMSALFLGYPVQRNDDYDAMMYMDYICNWFESKNQTACLAITLPASAATCLGFVHQGKWCGAFYVEDQKFTTDPGFVKELLKNDPKANVEASILPPEMTSSAVRFGFSLSMARQRNSR